MARYDLGAVIMGTVLAVMTAAPATAQTTPERCAQIGPATERLECYDGIFRSSQFTGGSESADVPAQGMWVSGIEVSQIEGTELPFATLQSEQLIPALPRGRAPARLTILCVDGETVAQFGFAGYAMGTPNSNSGTITLQYDRQSPRSQSLQLSADRTTLGFFETTQAMTFINQLLETERLFVRATPQAQRSITVSFLTEGIETALEPVREACGW